MRGPASSPHQSGSTARSTCSTTRSPRRCGAGRPATAATVGERRADLLAGATSRAEEEALRDAVDGARLGRAPRVGNDTFALLRAGTDRLGHRRRLRRRHQLRRRRAGRARTRGSPRSARITGDWGGGCDLGRRRCGAAARSEDGRGPATTLQQAVPAQFGLATAWQVAEALHTRALATARLVKLAPVVLAEARTDAVAAGLVERLAHEIVAFARATIDRLGLGTRPVEVFLGGGLMQAGDPGLLRRVEDGLHAIHEGVAMRVVPAPPIVGAALLALDAAGADAAALARGQRELAAATASA